MTTPSGLPVSALQYWGVARGAVSARASTAEFYGALNDAAESFGNGGHGLSFQEVNQLRSAAVGVRNASESFLKTAADTVISARQIAVPPYARSQDDRNSSPMYSVGIMLHTMDDEGETTSAYRQIRFTGQMDFTKGDLLALVQQDAEALADAYSQQYAGHDVVELVAV